MKYIKLKDQFINEKASWETLKSTYRRTKEVASRFIDAFKQEGQETVSMMRVFNHQLRNKLRLDTRGSAPTPEEIKSALEQLKDIPKLAPYAIMLLASPIPFSTTMYTGLALYLKKISGGNINLLPDSFNDIFKRPEEINIEEDRSNGNILDYDRFYTDKFLDEPKLNEIGEANIDNIQWDLVHSRKDGALYRFYLGPELYEVHISKNSLNGIVFYFSCDGNRNDVTNSGHPLRVMGTIIGILKDYLKNNPGVKTFSFVPSISYNGDNRRLNIYMAYIKKNFPGSKISKQDLNNGYVAVDVYIK
ncbi:MAG: hypothetical protein EBS19_10730 [Spirochaetia bacterium]|nr:hypothetical protein [Spirochaetia bacterium]